MKKLFIAFVILLLAFPIAGATATNYYINASTGNDSYDGLSATWTSGTNGPKATIQAAFALAGTGDVVNIADGTYSASLDFTGKAGITILGNVATPSAVVINAVAGGYGSPLSAFSIPVSNVTLKGFTLAGMGKATTTTPRYGIKFTGCSNGTVENLVIREFSRTGLEFYTVPAIAITAVNAYDNGGTGFAIRNSVGATVTNVTTSGNAWGGFRIQYSNTVGVDDIEFAGTNSFGEVAPVPGLYTEQDPAGPPAGPMATYGYTSAENIQLLAADFVYAVNGTPLDGLPRTFFYKTFADAVTAATTLGAIDVATSTILNMGDGKYYVESGMKIQPAVDAAPAGGQVMVGAGTYVEQVEIAKNLTLDGAGSGTIIQSPATLTKSFMTSAANKPVLYIHDANSVVVKDLVVDGDGKGNANYRFMGIGYHKAGGEVDNVEVKNIRDTPFSGSQHGVAIYAYNDVAARSLSVHHCNIHDFQKNAMALNAADGIGWEVDVHHNTIVGYGPTATTAQNGIQVWASAGTGSIHHNTVSGIAYTGSGWNASSILLYYGNHTVQNNTVSDAQAGVYAYSCSAVVKNNDFTVAKYGDGSWGVIADDPPAAPPSPFDPVGTWVRGGKRDQLMATVLHTITVNDNTISFSGADNTNCVGIGGYAGYVGGDLDLEAFKNVISGFGIGVEIDRKTTNPLGNFTGVKVNNNEFLGNTYGLTSNLSGLTVDAENNWWGSNTGPKHTTDNGVTWIPADGGDKVTGDVDYTPWKNKKTKSGTGAVTFNNGANDVVLDFTKMPPDGGTITVNHFTEVPSGMPAPPSNALPGFYLVVTSTIPNGTFNVWVTINGLNVAAADTGTYKLAYFNTATSSWVLMNGGFWEHAATATWYTYPTNHFTVFGFVGGALSDYHNTPATAYPVYIAPHPGDAAYLSDAANRIIYPNENWSGGYPGATHDWGWSGSQPVSVYIVPGTTGEFGSSRIDVQWTDGVLGSVTADRTAAGYNGLYESGDPYPNQFIANTLGATNYVRIDASRMDNNNFTPAGAPGTAIAAGDFIAKLNLSLLHPGSTPIDIVGADFRWFVSGSPFKYVYVNSFASTLKAYLGDVANASDETSGDGKIDVSDLAIWSNAYWSGVPGFPGGMTNYKKKFDIGPTADNYVFTLPAPDNKIEFEDLMIFSINYGLSAGNALPKTAPASDAPLFVSLGAAERSGGETRIPVLVSGNVSDLRGLKLRLSGSHGRLIGVEKGELLRSYATPVPVMSLVNGRDIAVDLAVLGLDTPAMAREGEVVVLRFAGDARLSFTGAEARTSANRALKTQTRCEVPVSMTLEQNYPNPFNPSTTIGYSLPERATVELAVYNLLGGKVAVLEQGEREAGMHAAVWNGRNGAGLPVASGLYVYRLTAGGASVQKTMMLVK